MRRMAGFVLCLTLLSMLIGCGKEKESSNHQEGMKHEAAKSEEERR